MSWGSLTYYREEAVERILASLVAQVGEVVRDAVPEANRRALLLIGGYGRGEGGVEQTADGPRPHNNLDFLLVTREIEADEAALLRRRIDLLLEPLRVRGGIGIDFSTVGESKLAAAPSLIMWYDMRHGHKTVLGDPRYAASLTRFRADKIPAHNARDLLVNRGSLLVINQWLAAHHDATQLRLSAEQLRRTAVRHLIKAVIGYGDALLYFAGSYHWSYAEKLRRMRQCSWADAEFAKLYGEAVAFRFQPDYRATAGRDVVGWQQELLPLLSHVHLSCESARLGRVLDDWSQYPAAAAFGALADQWHSPRSWARKAVFCARQARSPMPQGGAAGWGLRAAGPRGRLSLALPGVLYCDSSLSGWSAGLLGADPAAARQQLARVYLRHWSRLGDTNFARFVDGAGLSLDAPQQQPRRPRPQEARS